MKSYQAEAKLTMDMSSKIEEEETEVKIGMDFEMAVDYEAEKMKADIEMTMESTEEGKEAEFFSTGTELLSKIKYYLNNPKDRERMTQNAYARCETSGYSNIERLKEILANL